MLTKTLTGVLLTSQFLNWSRTSNHWENFNINKKVSYLFRPPSCCIIAFRAKLRTIYLKYSLVRLILVSAE